eukprot:11926655-Alexandrium_andersonii.AAC.1
MPSIAGAPPAGPWRSAWTRPWEGRRKASGGRGRPPPTTRPPAGGPTPPHPPGASVERPPCA